MSSSHRHPIICSPQHLRRKVGCDARVGHRREVYTRSHHWTERWRYAEGGWRMQGRDDRDEVKMCLGRAQWEGRDRVKMRSRDGPG
jgi:hypothetical protein